MTYRKENCIRCGRARVFADGVCEKCLWDNDANDWAHNTHFDEHQDRCSSCHSALDQSGLDPDFLCAEGRVLWDKKTAP